MWQEGQHLPYDGWYGGRVDMMIVNGTYADYRAKIIRRVEKGFYSDKGTPEEKIKESKKKLEKWDAQWEAMPVEERIQRRNRVADDVEIKEKIVYTARGPQRVFLSKPSCNNNLDKRNRQEGVKKYKRLPPGFVTKQDSPLSVQIPSQPQKAV